MEFPRFISTTDMPRQHLQACMLVGAVPFKALKSDPRVSYALYIPPEHLNPDPSLATKPDTDARSLDPVYQFPLLPLLINIHGTGRDAHMCRELYRDFAHRERVAILVPFFPAGIDSYTDIDNYKLLRYKTMRSDLMLLDMLDEVALRWPGIATDKVFMMGFSGGGQFVHRFMYLYPDKLRAVSIGAPGRVTQLDESTSWPDGIKDLKEVFGAGVAVDREAIRRLPIHLVVGGADNEVHGGEEFWKWLNGKRRELAEAKGFLTEGEDSKLAPPRTGRMDALKALQIAWQEQGIESTLDTIPEVGHVASDTGVVQAVQTFFSAQLREIVR